MTRRVRRKRNTRRMGKEQNRIRERRKRRKMGGTRTIRLLIVNYRNTLSFVTLIQK